MVELPAATLSSPASRPWTLSRKTASSPSRPSTSGLASSYSTWPSRLGVRRRPTRSNKLDPQFALQRLQLQGDRRLADVQRLGRAGHRAQARGLAKGPQAASAGPLCRRSGGRRRAGSQAHRIIGLHISAANQYALRKLFCHNTVLGSYGRLLTRSSQGLDHVGSAAPDQDSRSPPGVASPAASPGRSNC